MHALSVLCGRVSFPSLISLGCWHADGDRLVATFSPFFQCSHADEAAVSHHGMLGVRCAGRLGGIDLQMLQHAARVSRGPRSDIAPGLFLPRAALASSAASHKRSWPWTAPARAGWLEAPAFPARSCEGYVARSSEALLEWECYSPCSFPARSGEGFVGRNHRVAQGSGTFLMLLSVLSAQHGVARGT